MCPNPYFFYHTNSKIPICFRTNQLKKTKKFIILNSTKVTVDEKYIEDLYLIQTHSLSDYQLFNKTYDYFLDKLRFLYRNQ
jgi:hypothetical protein